MVRAKRPATGGASSEGGAPIPAPGDVVGAYRVLERVGSGSMGRVFEVEHTATRARHAMKTLRGGFAFDPDAVSRFFLEADAIARLTHPNVVAIVDLVDCPPWPPSFVMELLDGETLADALEREQVFALERAVGVAAAVASALAAAHAQALVHRDVKPDNVFLALAPSGGVTVKVLDFGVAKLLDDTVTRKHSTAIGRQIGTPGYMAPEQLMGSAGVDHRADIYGLGILLFEMLTGRLPWVGTVAETLLAIARTEAPAPSTLRPRAAGPVPAWLDELVLRCLRKQPSERPQQMLEILAVLRR
ncbi:MAG: serine/threonine protein kinase [Deltaproteobacteria bacterium]|nr:serine/threonine protein kinase [Deltaproteobacteria bacterium]